MASRTLTESVSRAPGPPPDLPALQAALAALGARFPQAVFLRYRDRVPTVDAAAWVAPTATLVGDVALGPQVSIWPGCVLRGDVNHIRVGARSNLQDGTVVHLGDRDPTLVGEDVVVGHRAVLHGCTIEDACLVGIQATVLDGARIGRGSVVGAGAVVPAGADIPPHSLVLGLPGKVVETLDEAAEVFHRRLAAKYLRLAWNHQHG